MSTKLEVARQALTDARSNLVSLACQIAVAEYTECIAQRWVNQLQTGGSNQPVPDLSGEPAVIGIQGIDQRKVLDYRNSPTGYLADIATAYANLEAEINAGS